MDTALAEPNGQRITSVDAHIAERVRRLRLALGLSMRAVATGLGVSWQQLAKFEHATDRTTAGCLYLIASRLSVPIVYFYGGLRHDGPVDQFDDVFRASEAPSNDRERDFTVALISAYWRIKNSDMRRKMLDMIRVMGDTADRCAFDRGETKHSD